MAATVANSGAPVTAAKTDEENPFGAVVKGESTPRHTAPASFNKWAVFVFFFLLVVIGATVTAVLLLREDEQKVSNVDYFATPDGRSCVCEFDENTDYFPENKRVNPDFSENWDVTYHGHYKKVYDKTTEKTSYLVLCGTPTPSEAGPDDQVVSIPIQKAGIDSTTHVPHFEYISQRESITHYAKSNLFTSACLLKMVEDGVLTTKADSTYADSGVDVAFTSKATYLSSFTPFPKDELAAAGIPVFTLDDSSEATFYGTAEFVEFISLFFNREQAANEVVDAIEARYECNSAAVEALDEDPKQVAVFGFSLEYRSSDEDCSHFNETTDVQWYQIQQCPDKECDIFEDAGAEIVNIEHPAFGTTTTQELIDDIKDVDYIIYKGNFDEIPPQCVDKVIGFLNQTTAGQNEQVYDIYMTRSNQEWNATIGQYYATDYFESLGAQPDVYLLDLISIFNPTALAAPHTKRYVRKVLPNINETVITDPSQCVDPSAPLFTEWFATPCAASSGDAQITGVNAGLQPDKTC